MHGLTLANTIVFGILFTIWSRKTWFNFAIKLLFLALMIANVCKL